MFGCGELSGGAVGVFPSGAGCDAILAAALGVELGVGEGRRTGDGNA